MADVPVGVQLSGGVDSGLVTAMMDRARRRRGDPGPIRTFSVGFDVAEFSELEHARAVAQRYGTRHHEIVVGYRDFAAALPRLAWLYDEPMGEPPAIPTWLMCREAKRHVSVLLCGEGADELFGGYSKYLFDGFSAAFDWMPPAARALLLGGVAQGIPFGGRRLRSMAEEQELLLQNLQVGIVYTGDGKMLRGNPRFAEMFGFADAGTLVGMGTACLYPDEQELRRFGAEVGKAFAAGQVFSGEWTAARQDGSTFDAYARARARVCGEAGRARSGRRVAGNPERRRPRQPEAHATGGAEH